MNFREKLQEPGCLLGCFSKTSDPMFIEGMALSGMDFVILDMEHGPNSPRELYPLILAARNNGMAVVVRVPAREDWMIQRVLDLGVDAIQFPQVDEPRAVLSIQKASRYYPEGERGVCRYVRPAGFSLKEPATYFAEQNTVVLIGQIEGKKGIENLDAILDTGGLDMVFIGPYDLSQSLGVPGQVTEPVVLDAVRDIAEKCTRRGMTTGVFCDDPEVAAQMKSCGVRYLAYSVDVGIFARACASLVKTLR
jgi:4-hydroxy-2-oxoheptanedioate aldolase